jgi:hypothetical protein
MSETLGSTLERRFARRRMVGGLAKALPLAAFASHLRGEETGAEAGGKDGEREAVRDFRLQFSSVAANTRDAVTLASGYKHSSSSATTATGWISSRCRATMP